MKQPIKTFSLFTELFSGIVGIVVGVLLCCLDAGKIFSLLAVLGGLVGIALTLPSFFAYITHAAKPEGVNPVLNGILLLLSLALVISRNFVVMILVGLFLIVVPILRISRAEKPGKQFREELPNLLFGVILCAVGPCRVLNWILTTVGICVIVLSLIDLLVSLLHYFRRRDRAESATKGSRIFVDETGDGVADQVYVDTTGDGKADTKMHYTGGKQ